MSSNEIGTNIIFKKQLGLNYEIDQKYVGLKMKENNILSFVKWENQKQINRNKKENKV